MTECKPPDPSCDRCSGSGTREVPHISPFGLTETTHEIRCLCTYPALWERRTSVRESLRKLASETKAVKA